MNDQITYTNIQRFSLQDGPGIRTTVFLKGCAARCPWCANPENAGSIEDSLPKPFNVYHSNIMELYETLIKDKPFYRSKGGVTFSGGEPLLQLSQIRELTILLKHNHINTCIETSLNVPHEVVCEAVNLFDYFYVDIKVLVPEISNTLLGININRYIKNYSTLLRLRHEDIICRIPFIKGYVDTLENKKAIIKLLKNNSPKCVELLCGHNLAKSKYTALGKQYSDIPSTDVVEIEEFKKMIESIGIKVSILKI